MRDDKVLFLDQMEHEFNIPESLLSAKNKFLIQLLAEIPGPQGAHKIGRVRLTKKICELDKKPTQEERFVKTVRQT